MKSGEGGPEGACDCEQEAGMVRNFAQVADDDGGGSISGGS